MSLKERKAHEDMLHQKFHEIMQTLIRSYPPSKGFMEVFKLNMFKKNNKAGFQQVVHYLMNILDYDLVQQKPSLSLPLDPRSEIEFRNEVMKYIKNLSLSYKDIEIPPLVTSHLISPGGFKFISFIFKFSQLVLYENVKRNSSKDSAVLLPLKVSNDDLRNQQNIDRLRVLTTKIYADTHHIIHAFNRKLNQSRVEAENIMQEQADLIKEINKLKGEISQQPSQDTVEIDVSYIQKNIDLLNLINDNFEKCRSFINNLQDENYQIEFNPQTKLPTEMAKLVKVRNGKLDLISFFNGFIILMEQKRFEITPMSEAEVRTKFEEFQKANKEYPSFVERLDRIEKEMLSLIKKSICGGSGFSNSDETVEINGVSTSTSFSDLAVPLSNLSESDTS